MASTIAYHNKLILAPMVRIGMLPMRLACLDFGADLVYTDEIIDMKVIGTERFENKELGTVDFLREGRVMFRCHPREKSRLVFQMGTSNPSLALKAAMLVRNDVAAIDVNCGCPKHFSTHRGMGAALLKTPDLLCEILETLVQNCGLPVTCKIRIYDNLDETIRLVKRIEATGVKAIGVHCRTANMRPGDPGRWEVFAPLAAAIKIPIIANGDVFRHEDIARIRSVTGVSSVMIARGAQSNPSVFRKEGRLDGLECARRYLFYAVKYDNPYQNCKYTLATMKTGLCREKYVRLQRSTSLTELCEIFGFHDLVDAAKVRNADGEYDDMFPYVPDQPYLGEELVGDEALQEDEVALR